MVLQFDVDTFFFFNAQVCYVRNCAFACRAVTGLFPIGIFGMANLTAEQEMEFGSETTWCFLKGKLIYTLTGVTSMLLL